MKFKEDLNVFFKGAFSTECFLPDNKIIDCILNKTDKKSSLGISAFDSINASISVYFKEEDIDEHLIKKGFAIKIDDVKYVVKEVLRSDGVALCSLNFD